MLSSPTLQSTSSDTICVTVDATCTTQVSTAFSMLTGATCTSGQAFTFKTWFSTSQCTTYDSTLTALGATASYCTTSGCNGPSSPSPTPTPTPTPAPSSVIPSSCPADGASQCNFAAPGTPPQSLPVSTIILYEAVGGQNFSSANTGVCLSLNFSCNAQMGQLYTAASAVPGAAAPFAALLTAAGCVNPTTQLFTASNVSYNVLGAFNQNNCTGYIQGFSLLASLAGAPLFDAAFPAFSVCNTDNCNTGAPAPAPHSSAAKVTVATLLAALLALVAAAL